MIITKLRLTQNLPHPSLNPSFYLVSESVFPHTKTAMAKPEILDKKVGLQSNLSNLYVNMRLQN